VTAIRALTYNIRSGTDILGRPRLEAQARVVCEAAPDLVFLLLADLGG